MVVGEIKPVYVYRHRRLDTYKIFYVGIGSDPKRPYKKSGRNKYWQNIVSKTDYEIEIIAIVNNWELACELEELLIQEYGRKDLGLGLLVNMTDGGEGTVNWSEEMRELSRQLNLGIPKSEEHREKCRRANIGKTWSEESRKKRYEATKGKVGKKVINTVTGIIYPSAEVASHTIKMSGKSLSRCLKGTRKNNTNFKYIEE